MRLAISLALCLGRLATAQSLGLSPDEVRAENTKLFRAACTLGGDGPVIRSREKAADYLAAGERLHCTGDLANAKATFQKGRELFPDFAKSFDARIMAVLIAQKNFKEAEAIAEAMLLRDPNDYEALSVRGAIRLYSGEPGGIERARRDLQVAAANLKPSVTLSYDLGRALIAAGDLANARTHLTAALRMQPRYLPAQASIAIISMARGAYAEALAVADEIQREDPDSAFARLLRGSVYLTEGKFPEAEAELAESLRKHPGNRDVLYQYGYVLLRNGKFSDAESVFERIFAQQPPDLRGLMGLSEVYAAQGQWDRALQRLDAALRNDPANAMIKTAWGNIAVRAARFDEGAAMFRKLIEDDPRNIDLRMRLAESYRAKGDLPKAIDAWREASEIEPGFVPPLINQAMALDQIGQGKEAAALYARVLELEPSNTVALNNYAYYLAAHNIDLARALEYARKAKSNSPADPMIGDTLGFVYLKNKLPDSAVAEFRALASKHPRQVLIRIHLAEALLLSGDKTAARQELEAVRQMPMDSSQKGELDALLLKFP